MAKLKLNKIIPSLILKEVKSIIFSTSGLIVGVLFIVVLGVLVFGIGQTTRFGTNDLTQVFSFMVFALSIAIPALVMGSISKEKINGTFEFILSKPLNELEFLASKFISYTLLSVLLILLTLPLTIVTATFASVDLGQIFMQYVGAFILATCFVSVGIAISSLFKSEIASFLTTVVVIAILIFIGSNFISILPFQTVVLERLSLLSHYQSLSRGVLDLRDLFYFAAFIFLFLSLSYYLLIKDKYPKKHKYLRNAQLATLLFVVIAILIGSLGQFIPGRIDFTSDQRYTLSSASTEIINKIPNELTINYYASSNLPQEFQSELRRVGDLLSDYRNASQGKIVINQKEPDRDEAVKTEAESAGITEIQFSVNRDNSAQVVTGYFGVNFVYGENNRVINFNNEVLSDLEYQITKTVRELTNEQKSKVGVVSNKVAFTANSGLSVISRQLSDLFELQEIELTAENPAIPADLKALLIISPVEEFEASVIESIKKYFRDGGNVLLFTDAISTNSEVPTVNLNSLGNLFEEYGVKINNDLVYDLENNNIIALQSMFAPVIFNFPQWLVSQPQQNTSGINKDVSAVSLLWASSIQTQNIESARIEPLLRTGVRSNTQIDGEFNTSFEQEWSAKDTDSPKTVGVTLENNNAGRAIIVSDADFVADNILEALSQREGQDREVISFVLNSVAWLTRDSLLGSVKAKANSTVALNLTPEQQTTYVLVSIGVPIALLGAVVIITTYVKRREQRKVY